jgi:signal peptidase I
VALGLLGCGDDKRFGVKMPSDAMLPTYAIGQQLEIDRTAYDSRSPAIGDTVVFRAPIGAETGACGARAKRQQPCPRPTKTSHNIRLLLRVVAGPGDRIAFRGGLAILDGAPESGRSLRIEDPACDICELPRETRVPADHWYLAADNRAASSDSRVWGPVPTGAILGKVEN